MSDVIVPYRFRVKRDTAAAFTAANTLLLEGEFGLEIDTRKLKVGDGVTAWSALGYLDASFWPYSNTTSGLAAVNLQAAIDELAAAAGAENWRQVKKDADESRASTTTLSDDSRLFVDLQPSSLYHVRGFIFFSIANAAMDFKYAFAYSGASLSVNGHRNHIEAGVAAPSASTDFAFVTASMPSGTPLSTAGGVGKIEFAIAIRTDTAGRLSFRWAQQTSDAGACKVLAGSYLEYLRF